MHAAWPMLALCVAASLVAGGTSSSQVVQPPMDRIAAAPGQVVTLHCAPFSPCASLHVHDALGKRSYKLTVLESTVQAGFGVTALGAAGVPRDQWYMECARDVWCLGGFGVGTEPLAPVDQAQQVFAGQVPVGTATDWVFDFAPMSGQAGGTITLAVTLSEAPAPVPAWAPDGLAIPAQ